ncbi:MAG: arsenic resistance N-acetyltransferase ArsN2 [Gemmatimonadota bacterium]
MSLAHSVLAVDPMVFPVRDVGRATTFLQRLLGGALEARPTGGVALSWEAAEVHCEPTLGGASAGDPSAGLSVRWSGPLGPLLRNVKRASATWSGPSERSSRGTSLLSVSIAGPDGLGVDVTTPFYDLALGGPSLRVAEGDQHDRAAVEGLLTGASLPLSGLDTAWRNALVAHSDADGPIACAAVERHGTAALLRSVVTAPSWRGVGLGEELCWRVIARAFGSGATSVHLLTTTAERFFARMGFHTVDRATLPAALGASEELRGACPASAIAMTFRDEGAA